MRRVYAPIALACAAFAAIPAAAQTVSVTARSGGPAVEVYIEAQSRQVAPTVLYTHATTERRLIPRSAPPPVGTFAYFGAQGETAVAVVTGVRHDGTVTMLHQDPYGYATEIQMNLRYPNRHLRHGRVVNDYVWFTGVSALAPVIFHGYAQPPPRVVVINAPRHGGHGGYVGQRHYYEDTRVSCLPPNHPGRGRALGLCKNHGAVPRAVDAHWDDHRHYSDRGRDHDDDDKRWKKGKKGKGKGKGKKKGTRSDKHEDRDHGHDNRSRKKFDV